VNDTDLSLLKASIDEVVEVETTAGERHLAQILFVFDEGETPDVVYLKVTANPDGTFVPEPGRGHSVLLSDIAAVRRYSDEPT
jgi:hypothetical protein